MIIKCSICAYEFEKGGLKKCPRCGKILINVKGCDKCEGCSVWKVCKIK